MNRKICGSQGDRLYSRGFGKRDGRCVKLDWVEIAYLCEKGMLEWDFRKVFKEATSEIRNFDIFYLVYRDLRNRGYKLEVEIDHFSGKKNYSMNFYPFSDMDYFYAEYFLDKEYPLMLSVVDSDGEVTYYMIDIVFPEGEYFVTPQRKVNIEIYGRRAFVFTPVKDYENVTYGKDEGNWGHFSILEARYLHENGIFSERPIVDENVYAVYKDLRNRGLIVKSGFKYGTHFRVYTRSMEEHSKYLVHVISSKEEIQKISRAVRVSHGVRKELLLAYLQNEKVVYFKFSWIRP